MAALDANQWTAIGTVATAVVALLAALFAGWQIWEIRQTRREEARPFVVVDIQPSRAWQNLLNLIVENTGSTVARDVHFRFHPPLESAQDGIDLESTVLVREGIPMLPPGRRIQTLFDVSHLRIATELPMRYDVEVTMNDHRSRPEPTQTYVVDLSYLYGRSEPTEYGLHDVGKAAREISNLLQKWSGSGGRLNVWVRDEDAHRLDEQIEHALTGHYPTLGTTRPSELLMTAGRSAAVRTVYRLLGRLRSRRTRTPDALP